MKPTLDFRTPSYIAWEVRGCQYPTKGSQVYEVPELVEARSPVFVGECDAMYRREAFYGGRCGRTTGNATGKLHFFVQRLL